MQERTASNAYSDRYDIFVGSSWGPSSVRGVLTWLRVTWRLAGKDRGLIFVQHLLIPYPPHLVMRGRRFESGRRLSTNRLRTSTFHTRPRRRVTGGPHGPGYRAGTSSTKRLASTALGKVKSRPSRAPRRCCYVPTEMSRLWSELGCRWHGAQSLVSMTSPSKMSVPSSPSTCSTTPTDSPSEVNTSVPDASVSYEIGSPCSTPQACPGCSSRSRAPRPTAAARA